VVGTLRNSIAKDLGLTNKVKIVAGAGDNAAAAVGTGTVGEGMCNISLGTSGTVFISSKNFVGDKNNGLHSFAHADGNYHLMGCILSAASCNKWWLEDIIGTKDYNTEQEKITSLGQNNIFFLPYLMGERSPHNDPNARGTFIGMTMDTTRSDLTQAVLEGVAFALRDSVEIARKLGIKIKRTKICGGGAKSLLWKKMISNILNVKVDIVQIEEGPAYGAAILAAVACGDFESVNDATNKLIKVVDTIEPTKDLVKAYEDKYQKYVMLYPSLKNFYNIMNQV
jgi:xylulokinase